MTQEEVNIGQKAHIHSFSERGPRGNDGISVGDLNSVANLMLVCHECHRKIDHKHDGGRYPAALLRRMKSEHELRVERTTGIDANKKSHILLFGSNIGDHTSPLQYEQAAAALFPNHYPAQVTPLDLSTINASFLDRDEEFWDLEAKSLRRKFTQRVSERIATGDIDHLSVFAIAPQPLLILLGTLLGDIVPADVYQRHREPPTWEWPEHTTPVSLNLHEPTTVGGPPALVIALSATVARERVTRILGSGAAIWTITTPAPHNDLIKSRSDLAQLRSICRSLFDRIKATYGSSETLHLFPACGVSVAVELGRVRMPKADMPWQVYDENTSRGGFIPALTITTGEEPS
ncbi:MAG: SAVED domain-containing protein [Bryobacterales bacterium]|nr:SAVED domain-containing protein [Bryobacterales bacterium]